MNDDTREFALNLYELWRVANINVPHVQAVYADACNVIHKVNMPDEEKLGRTHPAWAELGQIYEQCLWLTEGTLDMVASHLDQAVEEFKETDENAARELDKLFDDIDVHDPDDELTKDEKPASTEVPNWWNHDDE